MSSLDLRNTTSIPVCPVCHGDVDVTTKGYLPPNPDPNLATCERCGPAGLRRECPRRLLGHRVNPCNEKLTVTAMDGPGPGGASHRYQIEGFDSSNNPADPGPSGTISCELLFQNGAIGQVGVNGITHEVLLAILIDRLQAFQAGPYRCEENERALFSLEQAQHWLHARTKSRTARGVEGTMDK